MSGQPARGYLGISEVLAELRADFPDISVSKIRFLETEGLITPARSAAGYRRFCTADVDRLRFVLAAQRDQYLPLRVIKERLDRMDQAAAGDDASREARPTARITESGARDPGRFDRGGVRTNGSQRPAEDPVPVPTLSRRELVEAAGLSDALLTELETFGLLRRVGRNYSQDALEVARAAVALTSFGVEARHLRSVRAAAERETTMIESLVAPILRQRGSGARELAGRTARDCAVLVLRLHGALVAGALAEAGLAEAGLAEAGTGEAGLPAHLLAAQEAADSRTDRARGVQGASA